MDTIDHLNNEPLARRLGDAVHVSPLLRNICLTSGCPEDHVGEWLLKCAVRRGASHYERDFADDLPPDQPDLSDEELGVALCLGQHPYNPAFIRAAAQLLSSPRTGAPKLARLAVMERVEPVLLHIALVAGRFAPEAHPWAYLRRHLPRRLSCPPDALPHWSRFVSQTGVTYFGGGPGNQVAATARTCRMSSLFDFRHRPHAGRVIGITSASKSRRTDRGAAKHWSVAGTRVKRGHPLRLPICAVHDPFCSANHCQP